MRLSKPFGANTFVSLLIGGLCFNVYPGSAEPVMDGKEKTKLNRLAKESSPYLLQHADNPVNWYPWGQEAFDRAIKEKKLVFISIGYSSCHWCHVMEKESFSNKEVADILNQNFICIKVDREERPDIDEIYMTALHVMGARGGWPLSMFLTPDGKPVVGGTYFPREDREIEGEKVNGFKTVLKKVSDVWKEKPKQIEEQADHYAEETNDSLSRLTRPNAIVELDRALAKGAAESIREDLDPVHGGIGNKARRHKGTKFPMPSALSYLFDQALREKDEDLQNLVILSLDKMAAGGIYDQIGGGFHRYSTERTWTVPHFEKMLYDNAQLVELYARAYESNHKPAYERVIRETLAFIQRKMMAPEGGFYSALDADSNGNEGEYYVWTSEEINKVLSDKSDIALVRSVYGLADAPNFEEKYHILKLSRPLEDIAKEQKLTTTELVAKLATIREKLLQVRAKRAKPFLDTKILTAWNGQMIAGFAKAGQVLKDPEYLKTASRSANFILDNLRNKEGRLLRVMGIKSDGKKEAKLNGYLDDYAFFIHGLLNLHDATGEKRWLDEATALTDLMVKWYGDAKTGGYFYTSTDHEKLFARSKDYFDGAQPSANSIALRNLVRIWDKTDDSAYQVLAEKSFRQFAGVMRSNPAGVPGMCLALNLYLDKKQSAPDSKELKKDGVARSANVKTEDVVKVSATFEKPANGKETVAIKITIDAPWHIYANPVDNEDLLSSQTIVILRSNGKEIDAQIDYPPGTKIRDKDVGDYQVYEKEITVRAHFVRPKDSTEPIEVIAKLQACDSGRCLLRTALKTVPK